MGIRIVWFELEVGTVAAWRDTPAIANDCLETAWGNVLDHGDREAPQAPPVRRVLDFDYKACVGLADGYSGEAGDLVHDAIQGDEQLDFGHWPASMLRAYSRAHVDTMIDRIPDAPTHPGHTFRVLLHDLRDRGTELVSLWT